MVVHRLVRNDRKNFLLRKDTNILKASIEQKGF